jgi:hypothetical protein
MQVIFGVLVADLRFYAKGLIGMDVLLQFDNIKFDFAEKFIEI